MPNVGQELINKDNRESCRVDDRKQVANTWHGGTQTLYLVNGKWLTPDEISERYYRVGVDEMPE